MSETAFQKAREAAKEKLRDDMQVVERKTLFGVERTLTVKVVPDPHCKGCGGDGSQMSNGRMVTCHCITWGEIINE